MLGLLLPTMLFIHCICLKTDGFLSNQKVTWKTVLGHMLYERIGAGPALNVYSDEQLILTYVFLSALELAFHSACLWLKRFNLKSPMWPNMRKMITFYTKTHWARFCKYLLLCVLRSLLTWGLVGKKHSPTVCLQHLHAWVGLLWCPFFFFFFNFPGALGLITWPSSIFYLFLITRPSSSQACSSSLMPPDAMSMLWFLLCSGKHTIPNGLSPFLHLKAV